MQGGVCSGTVQGLGEEVFIELIFHLYKTFHIESSISY